MCNRRIVISLALLLCLAGCPTANPGAAPITKRSATLTPGQSIRASVPGEGGTYTAQLPVTAGRTYRAGIAAAGQDAFVFPTVELLISGTPLAEPISVRMGDFGGGGFDSLIGGFQTFGLTITPNIEFTPESDGTVTFELTNATRGSLPGVFQTFFGAGGTSIDFELLVVAD